MASLTGNLVAETYKALLKTIDNDILTASEKQITDGLGGGSNVFIDSQGFLRANKYKVTNGLATQFLKADGSLDSNAYLTSITGAQVIKALGFTPVTNQRTLTINGVTYNLTADRSWTVEGTAAVWGNITGTLSNQTDLQNALNAKYNVPAGTISQYIRGDGTLATFPTLPGGLPIGGTSGQILAKIDATDYNTHWIDNFATQTKNEVKLGQTLAKGAAVYVSSANGTNMIVSAASNTSEALSSKTFGLLETGGVTNDLVKCVTFGLLAGLDTSTAQAGDPVWLGVNGALIFGLANKPYAPKHLVYIGVVTRVQSNNGEIFVNIQNGFELKEIHDVYIADPANNHGLFYDIADGLWKNKSIATALGYTPQAQLNGTGFVKASGTTISYDNSTYLTTADAASTYLALTGGTLTGSITATSFVKTGGTSTQYLKADGSVAEITGDIISGAGSAGYVPKWTSAIVLGSSLLYDNGTSMSIGTLTLNYGGYGRTLTGSGFAATSFGFEAVTGSTTNGGLIGGLSLVIANNDSSRRIGSQIQSYISGATATNQGADLRFYVKPDAGVLLEIVRMTSAGITFNKDLTATNITATAFIKSGGTSSQFLMADGSVSTLSSPVTGSGSAGYIPKWTTAANIGSSIIYEDVSIGIAYTTPNRGGYGRTLSGASFGSASFGFEAVSNTTTNGGLIGGLSFIVNQNDSSRIVGSAIQSNLVGTTATNYGADLRFFAKADAGVIAEVARMTSAGLRVYGTIVKDGGTSSQFLMADGSVTTGVANPVGGTGTSGYLPKWTSTNGIGNSIVYDNGSQIEITGNLVLAKGANRSIIIGSAPNFDWRLKANDNDFEIRMADTFAALKFYYPNGAATFISSITATGNSAFNANSNVLTSEILTIQGGGSSGNYGFTINAANGEKLFYTNHLTYNVIMGTTGGKVLIGTSTDSGYKIDVNGTGRFSGDLRIEKSTPLFVLQASAVDTLHGIEFRQGAGFDAFIKQLPQTGEFRISNGRGSGWGGFMTFFTDSAERLRITPSGEVGIGVVPSGGNRFWVKGNDSTASNTTLVLQNSNNTVVHLVRNDGSAYFLGGNLSIGATTGAKTLSVINTSEQLRIAYDSSGSVFTDFRNDSAGGLLVNTSASYIIHYIASSPIMRMNANGNVLIGTSTDSGYKLNVNGTGIFQTGLVVASDMSMSGNLTLNVGANRFIQIGSNTNYYWRLRATGDDLEIRMADNFAALKMYYPNGAATFINTVTATSFFESSDFRLKTLIEHNPIVAGIENLQAKLYEKNGKIELGYFAQDAELIMPYAVTKNADGFLNLSYREVHTAKIARLEQRVAELEKQLNLN